MRGGTVMEQRNITLSQHLQTPEAVEVVPNLGACYVIDDNPENTDGGFDVTSDEKTVDGINQESDPILDDENPKDSMDRTFDVTSHDKPKKEPEGGLIVTLQNDIIKYIVEEGLDSTSKNKLDDSIHGKCSVTLHGTSDMDAIPNGTADDNHQDDLDGQFDDVSPIYSDNNQSGYEGDMDTRKGGESSGNLTDSDSETRKNLADKTKSVIRQKAIAKMDSIAEEVGEGVDEERSNDEDSDEPGSSCTDTMVSEYNSTDLEKDTNIPKDILYKLLGKDNKFTDRVRRCSKNTKRKLSTDDG